MDGLANFVYNVLGIHGHSRPTATEPIATGQHQVRMEFAYDGGGLGKGGNVTLYYDGKPVGTGRVDATQAMIFSADETTGHRVRDRHAGLARTTRPRTASSTAKSTGCNWMWAWTITTTSSTRTNASASPWRGNKRPLGQVLLSLSTEALPTPPSSPAAAGEEGGGEGRGAAILAQKPTLERGAMPRWQPTAKKLPRKVWGKGRARRRPGARRFAVNRLG